MCMHFHMFLVMFTYLDFLCRVSAWRFNDVFRSCACHFVSWVRHQVLRCLYDLEGDLNESGGLLMS